MSGRETDGISIPWCEPDFDQADMEAVASVVKTGFVNEGPTVRSFEAILCDFFGVDFATMTPNCTSAIALSLMALGVGRGDSVLVPDVTFIGTASAVRLAGATPILVDVDPESYTMDPSDAERRIREDTAAIVVVHLSGRSADMKAYQSLADRRGLALIEDTAEALASRNRAGYLGTQADAGCFSLAPTKIITSGQGGFVLTNSRAVRDNIVRLKDHGRLSRSSDIHPVVGFNFKVTDIQAALAMSQWRKLEDRIARARIIDEKYRTQLSDIPELFFPPRPESGGYLMWPDVFVKEQRDALLRFLRMRGITARPFWPPLHRQPPYAAPDDEFPTSLMIATHACWLPCSPGIKDEEIEYVIDCIRQFFRQ